MPIVIDTEPESHDVRGREVYAANVSNQNDAGGAGALSGHANRGDAGSRRSPSVSANRGDIGIPTPEAASDGIYLSSLPLAMCYVPMQQWDTTYPLKKGLSRGTIFPELDLPFNGGVER